jgi:U3 small nucleolar ribonucleoprotein protein LCP5
MAVADSSLPSLLSVLTSSLQSAVSSVPDEAAILPPKDGISLLDTKNELLLSYLQHLVFLILVKLRNGSLSEKSQANSGGEDGGPDSGLGAEVVKKLVELRVYLEKGVRPLEGRLKYQIDKVLRAAGDAAREDARAAKANGAGGVNGNAGVEDSDGETSRRDKATPAALPDELSYRPNPAAFTRPTIKPTSSTRLSSSTGVYRPPRITPTTLPTPPQPTSRRPTKSRILDEFLTTELSTAPAALPSIGSTIVSGGRRSKSASERAAEAERAAYEEANLVRLPKVSRKERAAQGGRGGAGYGGEEWRGLGEGVDRIERLTRKKDGVGVGGVLEKSRKRKDIEGAMGRMEIGERFENKRLRLTSGRRDRGRR